MRKIEMPPVYSANRTNQFSRLSHMRIFSAFKMLRPLKRLPAAHISSIIIIFAGIFIFSATMLILDYARGAKEENAFRQLAAIAASSCELSVSPNEAALALDPPTSAPKGSKMLTQYRELYEQNKDMVGWIKIDGTRIDYPVMYAPDDGEFYLSHGFDRAETRSGVPFIDKRCSIDPFSTNTIIYGHHMKNGTMFAGLTKYENEDFFKQHSTIYFDTLYEQRKYEIIAVFESRIFQKDEEAYRHYDFINAQSEVDFNEFIKNIKAQALYDTGISASYGDELLTLITCEYHTENGQFVLVAKKSLEVG